MLGETSYFEPSALEVHREQPELCARALTSYSSVLIGALRDRHAHVRAFLLAALGAILEDLDGLGLTDPPQPRRREGK